MLWSSFSCEVNIEMKLDSIALKPHTNIYFHNLSNSVVEIAFLSVDIAHQAFQNDLVLFIGTFY